MSVTGKEFVTPKITEEYPDNRDNLPVADRFRAVLRLKYDDQGDHKCIACGTCERVCPNGTISLDIKQVETWDGKKKRSSTSTCMTLAAAHSASSASPTVRPTLSISATILSRLCSHAVSS